MSHDKTTIVSRKIDSDGCDRNDEYKFDEECFPAKVSLLLRGSKGLGEEGDVCPCTFVPKVPSHVLS